MLGTYLKAVLQVGGASVGDLANVLGAFILTLTAYYLIQYQNASNQTVRDTARRNATAMVLAFLFYTYALATYFPHTDAWTVQLGLQAEGFFQQFGEQIVVESQSQEDGMLKTVTNGLKMIGLVAYVGLFAVTSIVAKAPLALYQSVFGGNSP